MPRKLKPDAEQRDYYVIVDGNTLRAINAMLFTTRSEANALKVLLGGFGAERYIIAKATITRFEDYAE